MKPLIAADLFCGAGGTSTGLVQAMAARNQPLHLTAINHWPVAIATHTTNHPGARHLCASLDSLNPRTLYRPGELDLLLASPECTHHSIARAGRPINDQSRASAWCVSRWAEALLPRAILVENVQEFVDWGPLVPKPKDSAELGLVEDWEPDPNRKGEIFSAWVNSLRSLGYRVDWRVLRAADYGDPTTRRRLFVQAVREPATPSWPIPTHSAQGGAGTARWVAARTVIDWSDKGTSIFNRQRPLAEATMRRILVGLHKYGLRHYLVKLRGTGTTADLDQPAPTITAGGQHLGLVEPFLIQIDHAGNKGACATPIDKPLRTIVTKSATGLVEPYLVKFYGTGASRPVSAPLDTVTTKGRFGLAVPEVTVAGERHWIDIRFRMLRAGELARAQGFPSTYTFAGTQQDAVRQIGNAVPVNLARALVAHLVDLGGGSTP